MRPTARNGDGFITAIDGRHFCAAIHVDVAFAQLVESLQDNGLLNIIPGEAAGKQRAGIIAVMLPGYQRNLGNCSLHCSTSCILAVVVIG